MLCRHLAPALRFKHCVLGEYVPGPPEKIRTLSVFSDPAEIPNFEYELPGTPCENVVGKTFTHIPASVASLFPRDTMLADMGIEAYVGLPLWDPDQQPMGLLILLHDQPVPDLPPRARDVLNMMGARAAAEMQRLRTERALIEAQVTLDRRVRQRTAELESLNVSLQREIAERRTVEKSLRESQQRYHAILNSPETLVARADLAGHVTYMNDAYARAFGLRYGDKFTDLVHPDDRPKLDASKDEMRKPPHATKSEQRWLVKGEYRWILWQGSGILDDNGQLTEIQGVGFDITDRKRAEEELRVITSHVPCILWRATAEGLPGWESDPSGKSQLYKWEFNILDDEAALRVVPIDIPPGKRYHDVWRDYRPPGDRQRIRGMTARALIAGVHAFDREYRCHDKHGHIHWLHEEIAVEAVGYGKWTLFGAVTDVTDHKRDQEALVDSERRYALAAHAGRVGVIEWDLLADTLYLSDNLKALLGYGPREMNIDPRGWRDMVHPDDVDAVSADVRSQLDGTSTNYEREVRRRCKDGSYRWFLSRAHCTRDPLTGKPLRLTGWITDIDDLKRTEGALRASERQHRAATEFNRRLLLEVDHRVRNNLAGLQSLVSLMRVHSADVPGFAGAIDSRLRAMAHVHELLSDSQWQDVDLRGMVESLLRQLRDLSRNLIPMTIDGPDVRLPARHVLPLTLILTEFFTNSAKYGAHASAAGKVALGWTVDRRTLTLCWRESSLGPITPNPKPSLGTALIESFATRELAGSCHLSYPPTGAHHTLSFPIDSEDSNGP
jgi:PAS domain S-box-containing protein